MAAMTARAGGRRGERRSLRAWRVLIPALLAKASQRRPPDRCRLRWAFSRAMNRVHRPHTPPSANTLGTSSLPSAISIVKLRAPCSNSKRARLHDDTEQGRRLMRPPGHERCRRRRCCTPPVIVAARIIKGCRGSDNCGTIKLLQPLLPATARGAERSD
ncbi:hypothetical protein B0J12DRAFT_12875 [Macrophomina phaseolina]|uniref:Uncharacterized protein n=1 Tax=Macrophomina phaseolina TaxID=35725 RepID=A0ABQ8GX98_9PEZI|nr:hypothetical protein B0J12DRAFT_12875 [Macrophomina phaseolina]